MFENSLVSSWCARVPFHSMLRTRQNDKQGELWSSGFVITVPMILASHRLFDSFLQVVPFCGVGGKGVNSFLPIVRIVADTCIAKVRLPRQSKMLCLIVVLYDAGQRPWMEDLKTQGGIPTFMLR